MPIISVIVPVYKVEKYLHRCVDSILNQTFTDFELILVDDGSPDSCGMICDEYEERDSRVHVIHQINGGLSAARNAGIDWVFINSESQWITLIDSDDWIHETYLEKLLTVAKERNVSVALCEYIRRSRFQEEGETEFKDGHVSIVTPEEYYLENNLNATIAWGKLYHISCFQTIRYPEGRIHEDEAVTHQILFMYDNIAVISEPLYIYFINPNGIMNSEWSPSRLDAVTAIEGQIRYMKKNGYNDAYKYALKRYIWNLTTNIIKINSCDKRIKQKYLSRMKNKLRIALIKYTKILPFSDLAWSYECAFPRSMVLFWLVKAQCDKVRKGIKPKDMHEA